MYCKALIWVRLIVSQNNFPACSDMHLIKARTTWETIQSYIACVILYIVVLLMAVRLRTLH